MEPALIPLSDMNAEKKAELLEHLLTAMAMRHKVAVSFEDLRVARRYALDVIRLDAFNRMVVTVRKKNAKTC